MKPALSCSLLMSLGLLIAGCEQSIESGQYSSNDSDHDQNADSATHSFNEGPVTLLVSDRSIQFSWSDVPNADRYSLYQASDAFEDFENYGVYLDSRLHLNVSSPFSVDHLTNHQILTFILTAEVDGTETMIGEPMHLHARGSEPNGREVRLLELVNRARKDPEAEALRYGIALNKDLAPGTISPDSKAPLAFNIPLMLASRDHSAWMLESNVFAHDGANGSNAGDRAEAAGYVLTSPGGIGENLAWLGTTALTIDLTSSIETHHEGLFLSEKHRENILHETYRESGVGQRHGQFTQDGTNYNSSMLTNKFGYSGERYFLTGVAFEAAESDGLYQVGSALEEVWIHLDDYRYAPYASGAFSVLLAPGSYEFSVSVAGEAVGIPEIITLTDQNIKRDVVKHGGSIHIRDN